LIKFLARKNFFQVLNEYKTGFRASFNPVDKISRRIVFQIFKVPYAEELSAPERGKRVTYKKYPNSKQFIKELNKGLSGSIYLFLGEEEGEKDKVINTILDIVLGNSPDRSNYTGRFHITDEKNSYNQFMEAADFAMTGSMFSGKRVCIIRNIDLINVNEAPGNLIDDMLTGIAEGTLVVLTSSKNQPPAFLTKKYEDKISIIQFWKYFDSDLYAYISRALKDKKISFDENIVPLLIEFTGNDIKKIDEALDALEYTSGDTHVTSAVIKDIIGYTREITVFDFIDSLFQREKRSLQFLKMLLQQGTAELLILNLIAKHTETMEKYHQCIAEHDSPDEALKKIGMAAPQKRREKFYSSVSKFSSDRIKEIYSFIAENEYAIKSRTPGNSIVSRPVFILASSILSLK